MLLMVLSPVDPRQRSPNSLSQQHFLGDFLKPKAPHALPTSHDSESCRNRLKTSAVPREVFKHYQLYPEARSEQGFSPGIGVFKRCPGDSNGQQGDDHYCHLANAPDQCHPGEGPRPAASTFPGSWSEL